MKNRKWSTRREPGGLNAMTLGEKPEQLLKDTFISLTRGEGLNFPQLIINQILTFMVMSQLKKTPGLLYAEVKGELKNWKGNGQTMTVWNGKTMPQFRKKDSHGIAMKFFGWVVHRKNTKNYYLTYKTEAEIPTHSEATELLKEYGKFYDGGNLVRKARPPKNKNVVNS